jgi:hypothetical protein
VTWTDLTVAAAFIAGAILGSAATIRTTRWILDYLKDD